MKCPVRQNLALRGKREGGKGVKRGERIVKKREVRAQNGREGKGDSGRGKEQFSSTFFTEHSYRKVWNHGGS